jgi:hypothetical protein
MPRPKWNEPESYTLDPKVDCYRTFAWEFLRRNLDYQRESEVALSSGSLLQKAAVATKFGLSELVPYTSAYEPGRTFLWLAETICEPPVAPFKEKRAFTMPALRKGEVALIFDLDATVSAGPAAIAAYLYNARTILLAERDKYLKSLPDDQSRTIRVVSPKIRKVKLFPWLRTYDAIVHERASLEEVARVLYPDDFIPDKFTKKTRELTARNRVLSDLERANSLVKDEYLALVPLDYLQNKSKRK